MYTEELKNKLIKISPFHRRPTNSAINSLKTDIISATNFLPQNTHISERIYYIIWGLHDVKKCPVCNNRCNYYNGRINKFCSNICVGKYNTAVALKRCKLKIIVPSAPHIRKPRSKKLAFTYEKICKHCNKTFTTTNKHQKYCTQQCMGQSLSTIISTNRRSQQFEKWKHLIPNYTLDQLYRRTEFLNKGALIPERIFCVINNITESQICKQCGAAVEFSHTPNWAYREYCSSKCCNQSEDKKQKTKKNITAKYGDGIISTTQLESFKKKSRQTCMQKYGGPSPMSDPEIRHKVMETRINRYGDLFIPNTGINEKNLLDEQEIKDLCKIDRSFKVGIYSPDGYCHETNTIYEIYERYHKYDKQKSRDLIRQRFIQKRLGCNFVIIWDLDNITTERFDPFQNNLQDQLNLDS